MAKDNHALNKQRKQKEEQPFTEDDYMDALRKASKPIEKTAIPTRLDDENEEAED